MPTLEVTVSSGKYEKLNKAVSGFNLEFPENPATTGSFARRVLADAIDSYVDRYRVYRRESGLQTINALNDAQLSAMLTGMGVDPIE